MELGTTLLLIRQRWWDEESVRTPDGPPASYVASGQWPDAVLEQDAPPSAHIAQGIARRLVSAMRERELSVRGVAELAGTTHPTILRIVDGGGTTDVRTIFLLEVALQVPLWPADLYRGFRVAVDTPDD